MFGMLEGLHELDKRAVLDVDDTASLFVREREAKANGVSGWFQMPVSTSADLYSDGGSVVLADELAYLYPDRNGDIHLLTYPTSPRPRDSSQGLHDRWQDLYEVLDLQRLDDAAKTLRGN
jgi:hypothetical protein